MSAAPALIRASKDWDESTRVAAVQGLDKIGNSETLPRKILAAPEFSTDARIRHLAALRKVRRGNRGLLYIFPETGALCQTVLKEEDAAAREGAQAVLSWLRGDQHLLRGSQPDNSQAIQELVRPVQGGEGGTEPETLLRATGPIEDDAAPPSGEQTFRQRLFGKRRSAS